LADALLKEADKPSDTRLSGSTYKVYRYMLKQGRPVGISDVQKGMGLSSPSVSQYHLKKLVRLGLIKEEQGGYLVDKVVLENVIRIRRVSVPVQTAYVAFFGVTLFILLVFLRPATINSLYFFAVVVNLTAIGVSVYEAAKTLKRL
jgi:predicted DNA-binding transcriptional regulator